MSLLYKDFFPFNIVPQNWIKTTQFFSNIGFGGAIINSWRLSTLTKLFWLGKSYDWSINVTYGTAPNQIVFAGSGTQIVLMSGDINTRDSSLPWVNLGTYYPTLMSTISGRRTVPFGPNNVPYPFGGINCQYIIGNTPTVPVTATGTFGSRTTSQSIPVWFNLMYDTNNHPKYVISYDSITKKYQTCIEYIFANDFTFPDSICLNPHVPGLSSAGVSLILSTSTESDIVLPFYGAANLWVGSISINFNNFWTP